MLEDHGVTGIHRPAIPTFMEGLWLQRHLDINVPSNWTKPVRGNQTEQHEKKEAESTLNNSLINKNNNKIKI